MPSLPTAALALAPAAILPAVALASGPSPMEMVWAPGDGHEAVAHQLLEAESRAKNHTSKDRSRAKTASFGGISTFEKLAQTSDEAAMSTARAGAISGAVGGGLMGTILGGFGGYMRNSSPYDAAAGAGMGLLAGMGIGAAGGAINGGLQGLVRDQLSRRGLAADGHILGTGQAGVLVGAPIGALSGAVQGGLAGGPPGALVGGLAGGAYGAIDGAISGGINGGVRSLLEKESQMQSKTAFRWPWEESNTEAMAGSQASIGAGMGLGVGALGGAMVGKGGRGLAGSVGGALLGAGAGTLLGGMYGAVDGALHGGVRDVMESAGYAPRGHIVDTALAGSVLGAGGGALHSAIHGKNPIGGAIGGAVVGGLTGGVTGGLHGAYEKMSGAEVIEWPAQWGPRPKTAAPINIKGKLISAIEDLLSKNPHMGAASHGGGGRVVDVVDSLDQADDVDGLSKLFEDLQSKSRSASQDAADTKFRAEKDYESGLRKSEKDIDHQHRQQDQFNARAPGGAGYNFNNATKPILDRLSALGPVPLVAGGLGLALLDKPIGELLTPTAMTAGNLLQDELFGVWDRSNIEDVLALEFAKSLGKGTGDAVTGLGKGIGQAATYGLQQGVGQAMLPGVLKSDPILSGASPDQRKLLGDAYTSMLRTSPNVAMIPHARDNYLRTVLQTGAGPDYATIGALARTEKDLTAANPWMGGGR